MRAKNNPVSRKRRKKVLKPAKGYQNARSRRYRIARETLERAQTFAYRDRKARKRNFRRLWIQRINAAARLEGLSYSRLMQGLRLGGVELNRKMLADLAVNDPEAFRAVAALAKEHTAA